MRSPILCLLVLGFGPATALAISIAEVQYSSSPGPSGTWPSDRNGQIITTSGVVTATDYLGGRFFIQDPAGGPWSGVLVWDTSIQPDLGDLLQVTGTVFEYNGHTEISPVTGHSLLAVNQPLPAPMELQSVQVAEEEPWEGVLVSLQDLSVTSLQNGFGEWRVSDGSGSCEVDDVFFPLGQTGVTLQLGMGIAGITGVCDYQYNSHAINPRTPADIRFTGSGPALVASPADLVSGQQGTCWLGCGSLTAADQVDGYRITLHLPPALAALEALVTAGTLSAGRQPQLLDLGGGLYTIELAAGSVLSGSTPLLGLGLRGVAPGEGVLDLQAAVLGADTLQTLGDGALRVSPPAEAIGDTLTLIMKPLLNLPAIVIQGETFDAWAEAPAGTGGWSAALLRDGLRQELQIDSVAFDADQQWWHLVLRTPAGGWHGLADLELACDTVPADRSWNAVRLLPAQPGEYWIAQVTDTHLPTHAFYTEEGALQDSSSMQDLRAVFQDLAVINPALILHTGDLVNEGELEDFLQARCYTKAQRVLAEAPAPVYLVGGNHDLGGWDATPPPDGTSRRDWWRFFGWPRLADPPAGAPARTQDYSFRFGNLFLVGLEAYDNYDNYLPAVYGSTSFRAAQLDWLQQTLGQADPGQHTVLFYHYDFANQLDLPGLGVDLALWGHIHGDSGSLAGPPWSLSTDQCTDHGCSFRLIRVTANGLQPLATLHACGGDPLQVHWSGPNDGSRDSLAVQVVNGYPVAFPEAALSVRLSPGLGEIRATGATVTQVLDCPDYTLVELEYALPGLQTRGITVSGSPVVIEAPVLWLEVGGGMVRLGWQPIAGATGYRVEQRTPAGGWSDVSAQGSFTATGWQQPLETGVKVYRVIALD
jgi:predicted MPP superfamily phosphohydrolase